MHLSRFHIWLLAIRPKTLFASIAPVAIGTAMAYENGQQHHWLSACAALLGALFIQIGTNLANDYFDYKKGADYEERIGPTRVTQAGLVKPLTIKAAIIAVFLLAVVASAYLIKRGGWPIAVIGVLSILSGVFYTAGPRPLGYLGLGEFFVFIFFGPVAVGGTYYVQTLSIDPLVLLAGIAPGLFSVAILTVNNLRDLESDRKAGKKTLAVRFGRSFAMAEYFFSLIIASLVPLILHIITQDYYGVLISTMTVLFAFRTMKVVFTALDGPSLNNALADTGKLLMLYSALFCAGWLM